MSLISASDMGDWMHRLQNIDRDAMTAVCLVCGPVKVYRTGAARAVRCKNACLRRQRKYKQGEQGRRKFCGDRCERCGFEPLDKCQLEVDHRDGDWQNNDPSNFWTLCANCHRLKTYKPDLFWTKN